MPASTTDPALIAVVLAALQAQTPTRPTLDDAERAVGALFDALGPRLVEGLLQAAPEPTPPKKGGVRSVRVASPCAILGRRPASS